MRVILVLLILILTPVIAHAEGMAKDAYTATILDLNRVKPKQNPLFTPGSQILSARILDKNQRTIGKVENIILTPEGNFQTLLTTIDATGFRQQAAFDVGAYVTEPTPDSFTVAMDKTQIKQNAQEFISALPPAAGENGPFTLKSLQNGTIEKADGAVIARVTNALVSVKSSQVAALLVTISTGDHRGSELAIPYEAVSAKLIGSKAVLRVTDEQADIIQTMATKR